MLASRTRVEDKAFIIPKAYSIAPPGGRMGPAEGASLSRPPREVDRCLHHFANAQAVTAKRFEQSVAGLLLLILRRRNHGHLQALPLAFTHPQRRSLPFIALEEFRIVISFAVHALPRKNGVVAWRQPVQREVSALVADCLAVTVGARAQSRLRNSNHGDVGQRLAFGVGRRSVDYCSVRARH